MVRDGVGRRKGHSCNVSHESIGVGLNRRVGGGPVPTANLAHVAGSQVGRLEERQELRRRSRAYSRDDTFADGSGFASPWHGHLRRP